MIMGGLRYADVSAYYIVQYMSYQDRYENHMLWLISMQADPLDLLPQQVVRLGKPVLLDLVQYISQVL